MDPVTATLVVLVLAVIAFGSGRIPLGVAAIGVSLALYFTGVLDLDQALAGFGDPTVLFIAALFVVSEALDATGVTAWAGQKVMAKAGSGRSKLVTVICLLVAGVTALISVNGAVAALLPLVVVVAARSGIATSQLLLPLAFAAHAGSMLALTGTPVNIIVSDIAAESGGRAFGFFEFALAGIPLLIGTVVIIVLFGRKLLPIRPTPAAPTDLAALEVVLRSQYAVSKETGALLGPTSGVSEVVVAPRSPLIGTNVFPGMTTASGDLVVLGARRGDERLRGPNVLLEAGDALLLQGNWDDLTKHTADGEVLVVDDPAVLRRSVPLGGGAKRAIAVLVLMIIALATGVVPGAVAALLAAGALVMTKTVSVQQAYRSISWTTVVLVAGMIPLSTAFRTTGTADLVADHLLNLVGDSGPRTALAAVCLLTFILGQIISNTATVLIVAPVAVSLAAAMDVSVMPFMMALTVAGAASFLTPIATPANLMVMQPGGYRFGDYWKLGLPLSALFLTVAIFWVPWLWPF